jgi:energy-coupling factor transporter ATP-binding protein EcfA2
MQAATHIHIKGAREHNLKNLEVRLPRGKLVVITGPSGSGKSSLAFDTLYAEGYRKYMESLSTQARQVLDQLKRPDVDFIHGLSPVLAIEQRTGGSSPRSTIATVTEIADYAQLLWALAGEQRCPKDGGRVVQRSLDDNVQRVLATCAGERLMLLAPALRAKPSVLRDELPRLRQRGFQRVRLDGEIKNLDEPNLVPLGQGTREIVVDLVIDRLVATADQRARWPTRWSWPSAKAATARSCSRSPPRRALARGAAQPASRLRGVRRHLRETHAAAFLLQPQRGRVPDLRRPRPPDAPGARAHRARSGQVRARGRDQAVAHRRKKSHHQAQRPAQAARRAVALRRRHAVARPARGDAPDPPEWGGGADVRLQAPADARAARRCRSPA